MGLMLIEGRLPDPPKPDTGPRRPPPRRPGPPPTPIPAPPPTMRFYRLDVMSLWE